MSRTISTASPELSASAVVVTGASVFAVAAITLCALTNAWDYTLAVEVGSAAGVLLCLLFWLDTPAERIGDRAAAALAGTLAAGLLCVYALPKLGLRSLESYDTLAGVTIGALLIVLLPARYVLRRAQALPYAAGLMLVALAFVPVALGLADLKIHSALEEQYPEALLGFGAGMLTAGLGWTFARRRRMRGAAWLLAGVFGSLCVALMAREGYKVAGACAAAAASVAWISVVAAGRHRADAARSPLGIRTRVAAGLITIGGALCAPLEFAPVIVAGWTMWPLLSDPCADDLSKVSRANGTRAPRFLPPLGLSAALFGMAAALCAWLGVYSFLVEAAAFGWTGPAVLVELRDRGLWKVSDLTFAAVLMKDQYLWRDEIAQIAPPTAASADTLIEAWRAQHDQWSEVLSLEQWRRAEASEVVGYGIVLGSEDSPPMRVQYVFDGSPAQAAGVRRGDTIRAVQGIAAKQFLASHREGWSNGGDPLRLELVTPDGSAREIAIREAQHPTPPVTAAKVLEQDGRKVGYIVLQQFSRDAGYQFWTAASQLRYQGIEELVLDLRINGGGWLSEAEEIGSVIGGRRVAGHTFQRLFHNRGNRDQDRNVLFFDSLGDGLSLQRVFVITSADTCSASEALIRGLSPYMDVITVGGRTCGKPVASTPLMYGERVFAVITTRVVNARGEGDYYDGLAPTCPAPDDLTHELGDVDEASLKAALHYIRFNRCPQTDPGEVQGL